MAVALLIFFAPPDRPEPRRFDVVGAAILAVALAALAWALSEIGPGQGKAAGAAHGVLIAVAASAVGRGLAGYALWERGERASDDAAAACRPTARSSGSTSATVLIYAGLSIMFFLLSFDLIDRRHLTPTDAGLAFLPFTLGVGLLSRPFGALADKVGARTMLIVGPLGAALADVMLALGKGASLTLGVLAPMALLGISFAVLVAPLTASVLSSVTDNDEGLASGINNAVSRVAQLAGIALAAGVASYSAGYAIGLIAAAASSVAGALVIAVRMPRRAKGAKQRSVS